MVGHKKRKQLMHGKALLIHLMTQNQFFILCVLLVLLVNLSYVGACVVYNS